MTDPQSHTTRLESALADRYKIERKLGEGGMATVYLAEDIKHGRKVAIKILRPELAAVIGAERFLAEIKTTANLQHPHILALFDSGEADGFLYYVMPFIDGETLREKLERERQLGVTEAVRIAKEVADALDYAHRKGVIHRDIKPGNILLHDGRAVVADFGIALAISAAGGGRMTETGLSLGTPHYMSPEQASADRDLSARSDVYSLGCVLYEMIAGQPPHTGPSAQSILVRILTANPTPLTELRHTVPAHVSAAVTKSIEKLPADRFDSAKEFMVALDDAAFAYSPAAPRTASMATPAPVRAAPRRRGVVPGLAASTVLFAGLAAWGWLGGGGDPVSQGVTRLMLDVGIPAAAFQSFTKVAVSGDGRTFVVHRRDGPASVLYVRGAHEIDFRPLPDTEGAIDPVLSTDGDWIVYVQDGTLMRVASTGSAPLSMLTAAADGSGAITDGVNWPQWAADGSVTFSAGFQLYRVPGGGGVPRPEGSGASTGIAVALPGGRAAIGQTGATGPISLIDFETDSITPLIEQGTYPVYVEALEAIVYAHPNDGLFVQRFDVRKRELIGGPTPVLPGVTGRFFSLSETGTLVYRAGMSRAARFTRTESQLVLLEMVTGGLDTIRIPPRAIGRARVSPDGKWIAFDQVNPEGDHLYLYDLERRTGPTQFTFDGDNLNPVWSPESDRVAFSSQRDGTVGLNIFVKSIASGAAAERLTEGDNPQIPTDWADGAIAFSTSRGRSGVDLWWVDPAAPDSPTEFLSEETAEYGMDISPDGQWVAYTSTETGNLAVYVRQFPSGLGQQRVSEDGGSWPRWSPDGGTIYYLFGSSTATSTQRAVMATDVRLAPNFSVIETRTVFEGSVNSFDAHPDDARLLIEELLPRGAPTPDADATSESFVVILNWFDEVRVALAAAGAGN